MVRNHRKPLKAMVATSKNHRKTIDGNGQTAQKHSMVMVSSKTIENLQWSLHAISIRNSKPERKEIDEAVIDYFIARSEPFRAVEDHFFRQMVYRMHRGYTLKLMSEMELARKIDAKIEQKPLLTIALKILKTIEKPLVPMVGPPKKHLMVMVQLCQNH